MNRIATAALLATLAATSVAVSGEEEPVENPTVEYREVIFEGMAKHMKAAAMIVKGKIDRKSDLEGHAAAIHSNAKTIAGLFPADTQGVSDEALPSIWEKPAEFAAAAQLLVDESGKLVEIAKKKDFPAYQAQFGKVGQSCGNCHESFRKDD